MNVGGKSNVKLHQGGASPRTDTHVKNSKSCYYCGKLGHYTKNCRKKNFNESKYKRHACNFVDREETINDDFKNIKLFISDVTLSLEEDDCNSWFIYLGASIHMTCHRHWFETYHEKTNGAKIYLGDVLCH